MNPTNTASQFNSGIGTQNQYGVAMNAIPTIPTPVPLVAPSVAKTTPVVSSGTASSKVGDITSTINQVSDAVAMNNAAKKGWNPAPVYSPDIKNANGQFIQAGQIIPQQEQVPDLGPDAGHVYIYDKATGAQTQIPIGQQIPVGFSTVDINKAPAVDTVDTANATFKRFSDGTYGQFDASGKYVGAANAKNFMDAKNAAKVQADIDAINNGTHPLTQEEQGMLNSISDYYKKLIAQQEIENKNTEGGTNALSYISGTAGSGYSIGQLNQVISQGAIKVQQLNDEMNNKLNAARQAIKTNDLQGLKLAYEGYQKGVDDRQKTIDDIRIATASAYEKEETRRATEENQKQNDIRTLQSDVAKAGGAENPVAYAEALARGDYSGMVEAAGNIITSGIGGEYNIYKKDMVARGLKPLSFDAYQTADANRKAKIAAAGATRMGGPTGLTKDELKIINGVNSVITNSPVYKTVQSAQAFVDGVKSSLAEGTGLGDIAAINQFQKVIDEGAVTRDQDVKLVIGAQTVMDRLNTWKKRNIDTGEVMGQDLRDEMNSVMQSLLDVKKQRLLSSPEIASQLRIAAKTGILPEDTIIGAIQSPVVTVGEEHKQEAINKKTNLLEWSKADPKNMNVMNSLRAAFPNAAPEEIYDKLKAKKYIN